MPVLIAAQVDMASGLATCRFRFDQATIDAFKATGAARWNSNQKAWTVPNNMIPVLQSWGLPFKLEFKNVRQAEIPEGIRSRLRPYQLEAAWRLITNRGFILSMEQRTGKTPTLIGAATALMTGGFADACVILCPASVLGVWEDQLADWANVKLNVIEGGKCFYDHKTDDPDPKKAQAASDAYLSDRRELWRLKSEPFLFVAINYDILGKRELDLHRIVSGRRYIVIADEVQALQNRKISRTKAAFALSHGLDRHAAWYSKADDVITRGPFEIECPDTGVIYPVPEGIPVASWGSTGTPQRNYPRNLWAVMHFALQGSAGTYRAFTERFCDGKLDDLGHWDDAGSSNEDELSLRLSAMSYRKLRRDPDVAPWLPKTDRAVILCSLTADQMKRYKKLEKHFAPEAAAAIKAQNGAIRASERGLKELVRATSEAKIQTAIDRAFEHTEQREVKVICTAHFHETLLDLDRQFDQAQAGAAITGSTIPPHFCAGGWMAPAKRREIIDRWKACPGPAILLINSLSSGVGIDLADADVMILLELEWVPADLAQLESRIQDIHLGKRTVPPILEYLLAKDTVDESMARALLDKIKSIEAVVGSDSESAGLKHTLRNSDLVESGALGLENNSRETVLAALRSVSERWDLITTDDQGLNEIAGDFSEHWEEDNEEEITF